MCVCVQSALPLLESCQRSSGIKDKRQRCPSKAQHTTGTAAGGAPARQPTQTLGCLSLQGFKDYTGQLWAPVIVTETPLGCQLSALCPCSDTLSAQQRPPLPLIAVLELEHLFLRKLYVLVLSPWLKNWSRSLNMTLFRVGKQQGSAHFALFTFPR